MSLAKTLRRASRRGTVLAGLTWWLAIGGHVAGGGALPHLSHTHFTLLTLGVAIPALVTACDDPDAKVTPAVYLLTAQLWVHVVLCHASTIHLHNGYHPDNGYETFFAHNQLAAAGHHHDHGLAMLAAHLGSAALVAVMLPLCHNMLEVLLDWLAAGWRLPALVWWQPACPRLPIGGHLPALRNVRLWSKQQARGPPRLAASNSL